MGNWERPNHMDISLRPYGHDTPSASLAGLQRRGGPARAQQRATVQDAVRAELFRRIRSTATSASRTRNRPARVSHPRACTWSLHHKARLCFRLFSCEGCPLALLSSCEGCPLALLSSCEGCPLALPGLKAPSTRTRAKSCAIIAALGEICGLVRHRHSGNSQAR